MTKVRLRSASLSRSNNNRKTLIPSAENTWHRRYGYCCVATPDTRRPWLAACCPEGTSDRAASAPGTDSARSPHCQTRNITLKFKS